MPFPNWTTNSFETFTNGRAKRSVSLPRTIEIMVVTDLSMWKNHGESLQDYVFALMASVSDRNFKAKDEAKVDCLLICLGIAYIQAFKHWQPNQCQVDKAVRHEEYGRGPATGAALFRWLRPEHLAPFLPLAVRTQQSRRR